MSLSATQNSRQYTDDFAQNARPTTAGIVDSLEMLRKRTAPFADAELASRLDLLLLPFLRGIPTLEQRVSRLQQALRLAADRLSRDYEIIYRHVFLEPAHHGVEKRREAALQELSGHETLSERATTGAVKSIEDRLTKVLADTLLDPEFERLLDTEHAILRPQQTVLPEIPSIAFQPLDFRYRLEIDDDDHRKFRVFRELSMENLLPDQRVAVVRYHLRMANPFPVADSVKVLSEHHRYIGTLRETYLAAVGDWMMHFIDLGERREPGETVTIVITDEYFDDQHGEREPSLAITANHQGTGIISLSFRLPKAKRDNVKAEARIVRSPHSDRAVVSRKPLTISQDGWVTTEFTGFEPNHQYGIFFPGLDLYK
jgi:hypothetical protein